MINQILDFIFLCLGFVLIFFSFVGFAAIMIINAFGPMFARKGDYNEDI